MPRLEIDEQGETLDKICGELEIFQARRGYRFGIETLLLSAFVSPGAKKLVDLGTGSGVMPMVMCRFGRSQEAWGVEIQSSLAERARRSVAHNDLEDRVQIIESDFRALDGILPAGGFDRVLANPPYETGFGRINENGEKAAARHEINGSLDELVAAAARLLKPPGRFAMVAPPKRLPETLEACLKHGMRPIRLRLAYGRVELPSKHFFLEAIRGGRSELAVEPPLIIYEDTNRYTAEVQDMLYPNGRGQ